VAEKNEKEDEEKAKSKEDLKDTVIINVPGKEDAKDTIVIDVEAPVADTTESK